MQILSYTKGVDEQALHLYRMQLIVRRLPLYDAVVLTCYQQLVHYWVLSEVDRKPFIEHPDVIKLTEYSHRPEVAKALDLVAAKSRTPGSALRLVLDVLNTHSWASKELQNSVMQHLLFQSHRFNPSITDNKRLIAQHFLAALEVRSFLCRR